MASDQCQVKGCTNAATIALESSLWEKGKDGKPKKVEDFGIPVCYLHYEQGLREGLQLK